MAKSPRRAPPRPIASPAGVTLADLLDRALRVSWRDVKGYRTLNSTVEFWKERYGTRFLASLSAEVLEVEVQRMRDQGLAPSTIKRKLAVLQRAFKLAVDWELVARVPRFPEVKVENGRQRVLEPDEEVAVFEAVLHRAQVEPWRGWWQMERLIQTLIATGGRLGETLALRWMDVTRVMGRPYVTFTDTKSGKPRTVPLTTGAFSALELQQAGGCPKVPMWTLTPVKAWSLWDVIRADVKAAGLNIDDVTLHTLRHTALTRLARGGLPLLQLQKWAGHSDPRITAERYTHLVATDLDAGAAILEKTS